ncbi:hypothetical protein BRC81_05530 [Halobacteriales archaeon QS_1_68_20]|nr:MAG: hypothetical protein BRC81_05530 [Halobacteriales archaeon QS_1_68_20]
MKPREDEIVSGSLPRVLTLLSVPLMVQSGVLIGNQIIDAFWLGHYSGPALAAVGLCLPVVNLLFGVHAGLYTAVQVTVSQRLGDDDLEGVRRAVFNGVVIMFLAGVLMGLVVWWAAPLIFDLLTDDDTVRSLATTYLRVIALGLAWNGVSDAFEAAYLGRGDSSVVMKVSVSALAANLVASPLFVFGVGWFPELGIAGAAAGTVAGYLGALAYVLAYTFRVSPRIKPGLADVGIDLREQREFVRVAAPVALEYPARHLVSVFVVGVVGNVASAAVLGTYTIVRRIVNLAAIPIVGLEQATQTVVGQNLGADRQGRSSRSVYVAAGIGIGILAVVGAVQLVFAAEILGLFVGDPGAEMLEFGVAGLRIMALAYLPIAVTQIAIAGFVGAGRTKVNLYVSVVGNWLVVLPVTGGLIYVLGYPTVSVFWATLAAKVVTAAVSVLWFHLDRPIRATTLTETPQ